MNLEMTILYDNNPYQKELQTDWGFSCFIDTGKNKILFDTGDKGKILLSNMEKLGIDPKIIDTVFLSHFHHDHTGGLKDFLELNSDVKIFYPKSFPHNLLNTINNYGAEAIPILEAKEILPEVFSLGELGADIPEQSMVIRTNSGIIVITGCAHPGIINILRKAKEEFPNENIDYVLGGFHLHRLSKNEIKKTVNSIYDMGIKTIAPTHCSGDAALKIFKEVYKNDFEVSGVGKMSIKNYIIS